MQKYKPIRKPNENHWFFAIMLCFTYYSFPVRYNFWNMIEKEESCEKDVYKHLLICQNLVQVGASPANAIPLPNQTIIVKSVSKGNDTF